MTETLGDINIPVTRAIGMPVQFVDQMMPLSEIEAAFPVCDPAVVDGLTKTIRALQAELTAARERIAELEQQSAAMHSLLSDISVFDGKWTERIRGLLVGSETATENPEGR